MVDRSLTSLTGMSSTDKMKARYTETYKPYPKFNEIFSRYLSSGSQDQWFLKGRCKHTLIISPHVDTELLTYRLCTVYL